MKTTLRSARALACALAFAPAFFCGADDQPPAKNTDPAPPTVATDPVSLPDAPPPDAAPSAAPPPAAGPTVAAPVATPPVVFAPPARPEVKIKVVRADVVMVDVWGGKFDVEHEGVVHHFNLKYGGLLFYKGKPVTLKSFGIGQQVLLEVLPDRKGKWSLLVASIVPRACSGIEVPRKKSRTVMACTSCAGVQTSRQHTSVLTKRRTGSEAVGLGHRGIFPP